MFIARNENHYFDTEDEIWYQTSIILPQFTFQHGLGAFNSTCGIMAGGYNGGSVPEVYMFCLPSETFILIGAYDSGQYNVR